MSDSALRAPQFTYAGNDPVNASDPLGLMCWGLCTFTNAAKSAGHFVVKHAAVLSTATAGLAAVAYVGCAVSAGLGCGLGLALSLASTSLSGVNAYNACVGGGGGCTSALVGLGLSLFASGAGYAASSAAAGALNVANAYAEDTYIARQAGFIGVATNAFSGLYGILGWNQSTSKSACPS